MLIGDILLYLIKFRIICQSAIRIIQVRWEEIEGISQTIKGDLLQ